MSLSIINFPKLEQFIDTEVKDMIPYRPVVVCHSNESVFQAICKMRESNIGCVVVIENARAVGIFTERDYLIKFGYGYLEEREVKVRDFMTRNPVCVPINASLEMVLKEMEGGDFRHLIVTSREGEVENVLSMRDVMKFLLQVVKNTTQRDSKVA